MRTATARFRRGDGARLSITHSRREERGADSMDVEVTEAPGHVVVGVRGELDLATAPELDTALSQLAPTGPVVVDLTEVTFLDSSGLAVLLQERQRLEEHGTELRLVITRPSILRVLEVTGLTSVLTVYATLGDATGGP